MAGGAVSTVVRSASSGGSSPTTTTTTSNASTASSAFKANRHRSQHSISPMWLSDAFKTLFCSTSIFNSYTSGPIHYQCTDPTSSSVERGRWPPPACHVNGATLCCVNDGQPIHGTPFPIPFSFNPEQKKYAVAKMTCGPACAKRWVYDRYQLNGRATIDLIEHMARNLFGIVNIQMAPPLDQLDVYGGTMPLAMYRSYGTQFNAATIQNLAAHLVPHHIVMEIQEKACAPERDQRDLVTRVHFPPEAVSNDPSRVMWNSEMLERPCDLPDDPVLPDDEQPTIFDEYVALHGAEIAKSTKRKKASSVLTTTTTEDGGNHAGAAPKKRGGRRKKTPTDPSDPNTEAPSAATKPRGRRPKRARGEDVEERDQQHGEQQEQSDTQVTLAPIIQLVPRLLLGTTQPNDDEMVTVRPRKKHRFVPNNVVSGAVQEVSAKEPINDPIPVSKKSKQRRRDPKECVATNAAADGGGAAAACVVATLPEQASAKQQTREPLQSSIYTAQLPPCGDSSSIAKEPVAKKPKRAKGSTKAATK